MPVRIETQTQMQRVRRSIPFCYLCGKPLRNEAGERPGVEHVLAKGSLSKPAGDSAWPVTLLVHQRCEQSHKRPHDQQLVLIQRVHTAPLASMTSEERAALRNRIREAEQDGVPATVPAISASSVFQALWHTVRGMHTALYQEYLQPETKKVLLMPAPAFSTRSAMPMEEQLERHEWFSERILAAVEGAVRSNELDGISAWNDEVRYGCIWHKVDDNPAERYLCLWVLETPESIAWAQLVDGRPLPWRGVYRHDRLPAGASLLTDNAIEAVNAARTIAGERRRIGQLLRNVGRGDGV